MRDAVTSLAERIGPSRRFFMVTPDPAAPQLSLSPVAERDDEGVREIKGLYFSELALLEDVAPDSPRSLTRIMGGVTQARVADRSEERRGGKDRVRPCSHGLSPET